MHDELRAAVLSYVANPVYKPVKPKVIAERLGLKGDAADELRKVVKKMVRTGELEYGANHMILPLKEGSLKKETPNKETPREENQVRAGSSPAPAPAESDSAPKKKRQSKREDKSITGTLRRVSTGDAYVRPEGTPAAAGKDLDIYLSKRNSGDAASGDKVRVIISSKPGPRGKPEGKLLDIVERSTNKFVGTYYVEDGNGLVEVDGKVFNQPIYVGDPGAKGAQPDDKVAIEMVRFPSHVRDGEGVIIHILGGRGEPGVDTISIKYEFGLPGEFGEEVMQCARDQAAEFDKVMDTVADGGELPAGRQDLTAETVATIDPVTARDFDDAISLKRLGNGHWELGVHIADVSHFVPTKTVLDTEAYNRATSVYLPDEVIPMLPEIISNNLASLQPDKVRFAMTARIEFTEDGAPIGADVFKSAIKSDRRFTYEEVDQYLEEKKLVSTDRQVGPSEKSVVSTLTPQVDELVGNMFELAMILRKRRFERGALELHMPELAIDLDKEGRVTGAHLEEGSESHQIIEEFMLAANEAVARKLADEGLIFLRRIHAAPDPRKSKSLTGFIRDLGFPVNNLQDRFELQELLKETKGDPRQHAVNFAALRSMQKAIYSPEDEGHYALASDCYCHFTSPIRRYPDLIVHRLLDDLNNGRKPMQKMEVYLQWGDHCSAMEGRATQAERELKKVKLMNFLADKIGMEMTGIITGVEKFGLFVVGDELPAEGFVHVTALGDDYYSFDRSTHSLQGRRAGNAYRLGDPVKVAVAAVDVDKRELDFRLLGRGKPAGRGKPNDDGGGKPKGKSKRPNRGGGKPKSGGKTSKPTKGRRKKK